MISPQYHQCEMYHRSQLFKRLSLLSTFRYTAYIERIDSNTHKVRFLSPELLKGYVPNMQPYIDLRVREMNGYLSAESLGGDIIIHKLT